MSVGVPAGSSLGLEEQLTALWRTQTAPFVSIVRDYDQCLASWQELQVRVERVQPGGRAGSHPGSHLVPTWLQGMRGIQGVRPGMNAGVALSCQHEPPPPLPPQIQAAQLRKEAGEMRAENETLLRMLEDLQRSTISATKASWMGEGDGEGGTGPSPAGNEHAWKWGEGGMQLHAGDEPAPPAHPPPCCLALHHSMPSCGSGWLRRNRI